MGVVRTGDELIAPRTATEFHADWVQPNDIEEGLFVRLTEGAKPASFIVAGSKRSRPFDTQERVNLIRELVPHLQQALSTQRQLTALAERAQNFAEAVDLVPQGIVIVTQDMHIVECNSAASRILSEGDGLGVLNGALSASMPNGRRNLHSLAYQALTSEGVRSGGSGTCERISGKRAYVVHVLPLDPLTVDIRTRPLALVLIVDPARQPLPVGMVLRQLYALTKAEASVAHLVVNGDGVRAISDRLSISSATVRTHLRAIFSKTGTHRQAELVRLLSTIAP